MTTPCNTPRRLSLVGAIALFAAGPALASDWPSYNRTPTAERFAPERQIDRTNVAGLKPICSYDLGLKVGFETSPIVIGRTLYVTTEKDTVALDADTCRAVWRVHEDARDGRTVNRGAAYADGKLYRGLQDGRVVAYDAATGHKLWERVIADPVKGESVPAAPLVWRGLVFIGNAGGDIYGIKGRIYALDAATGEIRWESYMVPKAKGDDGMKGAPAMGATWANGDDDPISGAATWTTYSLDPDTGILYVPGGNPAPDFNKAVRGGENLFANTVVALDAMTGEYRKHFSVVREDFHDWDVAAAPALLRTRAGHRIMAVTPKDGVLHAFDLASGRVLYRTPVTKVENTEAPLTVAGTYFCPGSTGGTEWNGPAYSPATNLIYTGSVDWCSIVRLQPPANARDFTPAKSWTGAVNNMYGEHPRPAEGWLTAIDADTGRLKWKFHTPNAIVSGVTPTAGGVVFFGDLDGTAYALDDRTGKVLWRAALDGGAGGGVITYAVDGKQRVVFTAGLNSVLWPSANKASAKVVVWGLR